MKYEIEISTIHFIGILYCMHSVYCILHRTYTFYITYTCLYSIIFYTTYTFYSLTQIMIKCIPLKVNLWILGFAKNSKNRLGLKADK